MQYETPKLQVFGTFRELTLTWGHHNYWCKWFPWLCHHGGGGGGGGTQSRS